MSQNCREWCPTVEPVHNRLPDIAVGNTYFTVTPFIYYQREMEKIDNIGTIFLYLAYRLTHSDFWLNVSAYLLGPNLNVMPKVLITSAKTEVFTIGAQPFVAVDGAHTLWVTLVYSLIFAAVAIILTWRRDVQE